MRAATNQLNLFDDEKLRKIKNKYLDAMNIIHEEIKENGENKENKIYEFEKKFR